MKRHLLWDWNGTLLDDTRACVDALNVMLVRRSLPPLTLERYRATFAFPVRRFYAALGLRLEHEDWDALAREYHDLYAEQPKALNAETFAALELARSAGVGQSIISALRQDLLDGATAAFGVAPYMREVFGVDNLDGSSKLGRAHELVARLTADGVCRREEMVLIGDALHDKEVADALGVRCVLCAQGSHAHWRLTEAAPTGRTLTESVRLALADA